MVNSIEACVETVEESVLAEKKGATRLELCSHLEVDGLTPSLNLVKEVMANVSIPIKVMIRPRQGNFLYTPTEILKMTASIYAMKDLGVYGVVFGLLNKYRGVDFINTASLAEIAKPLNVTFHKAIDYTNNILESTDILSDISSVDALLTSGGKPTANDGIITINKMIERSTGKLEIIAAGKVTTQNLEQLSIQIHSDSFHGRRIV